jgi:ATP-dependent exoDNAse (exonuclease V) beta subunit
MQRAALPDARDLNAVTDSVCEEADVMDRRDEVLEMARRCLASESVRRAIASASYQREVPFTVLHDGGFATGRVDLLYSDEDGNGITVIDYKTDDVAADRCEAHAQEHHSGQADVYTRAVSEATGLAVRKVVFVFCRPGVEVVTST